jgi:hypothetical protein
MSFTDVFNVTFEPDEPIQPGKGYELQIDEVRLRESAAGRPTAMVTFHVAGGAAPTDTVGKSFPVFYVLEGRGAAYLRPLLQACGLPTIDGQVTFKSADLVGKKAVADVAIDRTGDVSFFRVRNVKAAV